MLAILVEISKKHYNNYINNVIVVSGGVFMEELRFTLRMHPIAMKKMKYIAKANGRSLNKEIEQILKWVIEDYENKYGRISISNESLSI